MTQEETTPPNQSQPAQPKRTRLEILAKAREIRKLKGKLTGPHKVAFEKQIELDVRKEFRDKVGKMFPALTNKMLDLAFGIQVVIARGWEYEKGVKKRTGRWYQVSDPQEIVDLMNGLEDGEDDSYYKIVTKEPNEKILTYIGDQLMGKAPQKLNVDHGSTQLADILSEIRSKNRDIVKERIQQTLTLDAE
jgi:hypothetical protein